MSTAVAVTSLVLCGACTLAQASATSTMHANLRALRASTGGYESLDAMVRPGCIFDVSSLQNATQRRSQPGQTYVYAVLVHIHGA